MPVTLYTRKANLFKAPKSLPLNELKANAVVGDIHGNALKLIYTAIEEGIIRLHNDTDYYTLLDIYLKDTKELTLADLSTFQHIMDRAYTDNTRRFTIIGDELADRGQNDYFTLLVLKKLRKESVPVSIILSNHSAVFLEDYEKPYFTGMHTFNGHNGQGNSLMQLRQLVWTRAGKKALVSEQEVRQIVENDYLPSLKAIDYSVSSKGELTLFTHAPVGLETVQALAKSLDIKYKANTIKELIHTIDQINIEVDKLAKEKKLTERIVAENHEGGENQPIAINKPFNRLIWNRILGTETITEAPFPITFCHGHIGTASMGEQFSKTHVNHDTLFGKNIRTFSTGPHQISNKTFTVEHKTGQSDDLDPEELKLFLESADDSPAKREETMNEIIRNRGIKVLERLPLYALNEQQKPQLERYIQSQKEKIKLAETPEDIQKITLECRTLQMRLLDIKVFINNYESKRPNNASAAIKAKNIAAALAKIPVDKLTEKSALHTDEIEKTLSEHSRFKHFLRFKASSWKSFKTQFIDMAPQDKPSGP